MFLLLSRMSSDKVEFCEVWKSGYETENVRFSNGLCRKKSSNIFCHLGNLGVALLQRIKELLITTGKLDPDITDALTCFFGILFN